MLNVRVNDIGQINIPSAVTEMMGIGKCEELVVLKRNGYFIVTPTSTDPLDKIRKACEGLAEEAGWKTDEDIVNYMRELRKERYLQNADND